MARRKRGRSGAVAHVSRLQVGARDDVTMGRDCKHAKRVGGQARMGNGLAADAMRERDLADGRAIADANRNIRLQDAAMRPRGEHYQTEPKG